MDKDSGLREKGRRRLPTLVVALAVPALLIAFAAGRQAGRAPAPPFHTGGALFPEPSPAAPPAGPVTADNPMMLLARPKNFSAARVSSFARNGLNLDTLPVPPDGREVTLADLKGPGAITHIWMTYRGGSENLILRIYWDGHPEPSVEAPLGDFFGVALGLEAPVSSLPVQCTSGGQSKNAWWYMPFNSSARVTLTNLRSPDHFKGSAVPLRHQNRFYYHVDYQSYARPLEDLRYFHARFLETEPAERGQPVTLLDIEGQGHFVGIVLGNRSRTPGWFGEGDDIFTVDGRLAMVGTGTEDYFCDAWGLRVFDEPYFGCPVFEGREIGDRTSLYRFHIADPIPFRRSFKFEIEHWPWISEFPNTGRDYFSSLGFWYQKGFHRPWPRLGRLVQAGPWDPAKGRWRVAGALEAEDLGLIGFKSLKGEAGRPERVLLTPNQSGDHMLQFDSGGAGELTLAVPAEAEGTYDLKIHFLQAPDYGIVQLAVNGRPVGEAVDLFRAFAEMFPRPVWPPREYVFRGVALRAGVNALTFAVNGKNPESEGARIGIDCLVLEKAGGPAAPSRSDP
ncbi:MAG TPA: DUF2961 domain-containing protein [Candidatus Aminicenantes bacterium]|nr:DUF2961 domain-containing protein [Candidatus Aminicenantes bacterium]HRY65703.1 DUF2961 domain-containing protein [Candidatus Aminicenantes bacterium]HRZ72617.1 DUF2961 domain-containing protein [Candidatus Aminicenantes bacterium]